MLLFTAITSRCSIYAMFGIGTCPLQKS